MLNWIITFFILAVIASLLGFGGLAGTFIGIAQFLAYVFIAFFVISLVFHFVAGRTPNPRL